MKSHAQAVVIGGGVIGCSILYHLAKLGWSDVALLERDEFTSGSTWHAAANIHGLHDSTNISRIQHYTMNLYNELEAETGQSCGVFQPGSLYLAQTEEREHQLRLQAAKVKFYGMNFHEVSRAEAEALRPLVNYDGIRCIMYETDGSNVDPSGVTNAYAIGARQKGAVIERFCPVTENIICAKRGRAFWLGPMKKMCGSGPRTARRRALAMNCLPMILNGSNPTCCVRLTVCPPWARRASNG